MDNGSSDHHPVDASSSDEQSITDLVASEKQMEDEEIHSNENSEEEIVDEEMNSDENNEAVSLISYLSYFSIFLFRHRTCLMTSKEIANEQSIQVPIGVAICSGR
jgi:hypothetical protein